MYTTETTRNTRRRFLRQTALSLAGAAMASSAPAQSTASRAADKALPPGAPPAFGTAPAAGPQVSTDTFAQAEKLVQVELTAKDRAQVAGNWRQAMAPLYERRVGPRIVPLPGSVAPAAV